MAVCESLTSIRNPIVGFAVKDRLGQIVFGHNTYVTYASAPDNNQEEADQLSATFEFVMPGLQAGEYVIDIAVASGTQVDHVQHHWIHGATKFYAQPVGPSFGQFVVPMSKISLDKVTLAKT